MLYGIAGWLTTGIRTTALADGAVVVPSQRVNALGMGGGVETALSDHWAARFEYEYAAADALHDITLDIGTITGPVTPHVQMQTARIGVIYMFDGR